jgi:hypothetical protein
MLVWALLLCPKLVHRTDQVARKTFFLGLNLIHTSFLPNFRTKKRSKANTILLKPSVPLSTSTIIPRGIVPPKWKPHHTRYLPLKTAMSQELA